MRQSAGKLRKSLMALEIGKVHRLRAIDGIAAWLASFGDGSNISLLSTALSLP